MSLWSAHDLIGHLAYVFILTGLLLAAGWWLIQGVDPYSGDEDSWKWFGRREMSELSEDALKVLTFFKSWQTKKIVLIVSGVFLVIVIISWYVDRFILPISDSALKFADNKGDLWAGAFGAGFFFALAVHGNIAFFVLRYTLKHWDQIQNEYEPWPKDKPYYYSLKFWRSRVQAKKRKFKLWGYPLWWWALLAILILAYAKGWHK